MTGVLVRCTPKTAGDARCRVTCWECGLDRAIVGPHPRDNHREAGALGARHAAGDHEET